jgi:hypothetical protein
MNERPMTDARISRALRAHLPERATAELRERVLNELATTKQQRPMPGFLGGLTDADPVARRRALLVAAALLIGLTIAVSAGVGAWLQSQHQDDPFLLGAPQDVDRYVAEAYRGLEDLPALRLTVLEVRGPKGRWTYNGAGVVRLDHFSSETSAEPASFRIFSGDQMAEIAVMNGTTVWLVYQQQAAALDELARATGLNTACQSGWTYVELEYLIGRPTHHVACDTSLMWLDVETGLPLRSEWIQEDHQKFVFVALEFEVGPQPPELFEPPAGLAIVSDDEYRCATEKVCEVPATPTPPAPTPPPAPGDYAVPPDLDAFVAEVVANHAALGALEMTVVTDLSGGDRFWRYFYDGAGQSRREYYYDGPDSPTVLLNLDGVLYESYGLTEDGRTLWQQWPGVQAMWIPDFKIGHRCPLDWEHHGFDLVGDRPAHHLVCDESSIWVDVEWLLPVRSQIVASPFDDETWTEELIDLRLGPQPAELFVLPPDAEIRHDIR